MKEDKTQSWLYKCLSNKDKASSSVALTKEDLADLTEEFLLDLRSIFEHFVRAFENLKKENIEKDFHKENLEKFKGSILIYDLKELKGFMLFRKGYRLIFSYVKPGCIKVQFLKQKPFGETEVFVEALIKAVTYGTMSINWVHENQTGFLSINILARYYMRRFLGED